MLSQGYRIAIMVVVTILSITLIVVELVFKHHKYGIIWHCLALIVYFVVYCIVLIVALINLQFSPKLHLYMAIVKACFCLESYELTIAITIILDAIDKKNAFHLLQANLFVFSLMFGAIIAVCTIRKLFFDWLDIGFASFLGALMLQFCTRIVQNTNENLAIALVLDVVTVVVGAAIASLPDWTNYRQQLRQQANAERDMDV